MTFDLLGTMQRIYRSCRVVAEADGAFYNFDPTFEDTGEDFPEDGRMRFGFSDELMAVKHPDRDDIRPKCTDPSRDFSCADLIVENITDDGWKNVYGIWWTGRKRHAIIYRTTE